MVSFVESIVKSGCCLKSFRVVLKFGVFKEGHAVPDIEVPNQEAALHRIAGFTALAKVIADMKCTNFIEVSIFGFTGAGLRSFDQFASRLSATKQWSIDTNWRIEQLIGGGNIVHAHGPLTEQSKCPIVTKDTFCKILYIWTWTIGPTVLHNR